jgi:site-specific DNA-methyltransferase (adenine-specific)
MSQLPLFEDKTKIDDLSISEVSKTLNVSSASVRNWLKTGQLRKAGNGLVAKSSFESFLENTVGSTKLTKRANKSKLDDHDHFGLSERILAELAKGEKSAGQLASEYESSLSQSYRNIEGIFYTPESVCHAFFGVIDGSTEELVFCDPCCGSGEFLLAALHAGFSAKNLVAFDTDPVAVEIARRRVFEFSGIVPQNIFCADFLDGGAELISESMEIDVIFTNPPWGKKIAKEQRVKIAGLLDCRENSDTISLFLAAAFRELKPGGYLGLLLPESFFNVAAFSHSRSLLLKESLLWLRDFGKIFDGLLTSAQAFTIRKSRTQPTSMPVRVVTNCEYLRTRESFQANPNQIINLRASNDEASVIEYLLSKPHITLKGRARWALGIVTGNNAALISNTAKASYAPIFKGSDISIDGLKEPTSFVSRDFSQFQQVAPLHLYEAKEKLIYRFISNRLVFLRDTSGSLILNSANLLIPDEDFPMSMSFLAKYLSSDLMNWLFNRIFSTHKVLRSDLEQLPIFSCTFGRTDSFDEFKLLNEIGIMETGNGSYRVKK